MKRILLSILIICIMILPVFADRKYIVTFRIYEIPTHSIKISLPVDEDLYRSLHVGEYLSERMMIGGLLLRSDFSRFKVRVISKSVVETGE